MKKFALQDHELVPTHVVLTSEEEGKVLKEYGVEAAQLPKIHISDPVIKDMEGVVVGDVIKIVRESPTAKQSIFYRLVIN
ncbi:MAG: DNA-directed RNA polymerase subunit H [Euryarchaeota archaeon]|nr:DNA-directed RNA polymerase subunit H [Euryarchaeota archaeon]